MRALTEISAGDCLASNAAASHFLATALESLRKASPPYMAAIRLRNCSIIRYPILPFGFLAISIITAFTCYYTWPTTRNVLSPYFSKPQDSLPEHLEVEDVRHVRIAIEEAGGSLSLRNPKRHIDPFFHSIQDSTRRFLEP